MNAQEINASSVNTRVIHGVFMEISGKGVLLKGPSGVGKSETALGLIDRGHSLVADDIVVFERKAEDRIVGTCPESLCDFIEIRGLGVFNIRRLFGDAALKKMMPLDLILNFLPMTKLEFEAVNRFQGLKNFQHILDLTFPEITIPILPERTNLPLLVEFSVKNHLTVQDGYDAGNDFLRRQDFKQLPDMNYEQR